MSLQCAWGKRLIRTFDYYSSLLEMNKPIDGSKCIVSIIFEFCGKKERHSQQKLKKETIENYYATLRSPRKNMREKASG